MNRSFLSGGGALTVLLAFWTGLQPESRQPQPREHQQRGGGRSDDKKLAALIAGGELDIDLGSGSYTLTRPLNLRERTGLRLRGHGATLKFSFSRELKDAPAIDMSGAMGCRLEGIQIVGDRRGPPAAGILLARTSARSAHAHTFERVGFDGVFSVANVYNIGSEVNRWENCALLNTVIAGFACNYYTSSWNDRGIVSPFGPIAGGAEIGKGGAISNVEQTFTGCALTVDGAGGERANIVLRPRTIGVRFRDCCITNKKIGEQRGMAFLVLGAEGFAGEQLASILIDGCYLETFGAESGVRVLSRVRDLTISNTSIQAAGSPLDFRATVDGFRFEGGQLQVAEPRQRTAP